MSKTVFIEISEVAANGEPVEDFFPDNLDATAQDIVDAMKADGMRSVLRDWDLLARPTITVEVRDSVTGERTRADWTNWA